MSDHSIIIDLQNPGSPRFECNAEEYSPCFAQWDCDCENIWDYQVIDSRPTHSNTAYGSEPGHERHTGYFDSTECNLTEWHDNQDEAVEGFVRVDVTPVNEIDFVTFMATAARIEADQ